MGYPEAEYAAQKVINALSGGSSSSGILSPLPDELQISASNGQLKVTISGDRTITSDGKVISFTNLVRFAVNDKNIPQSFDDYTDYIDFDMSLDDSDTYSKTLTKEIDLSNVLYYRIFAKSSTGVLNDTINGYSYEVAGTIIPDDYTDSSRYSLIYPCGLKYYLNQYHISQADTEKLYYTYNDTVATNFNLSNKEGSFDQFDRNHTGSNWLSTSWFKKVKPFVIDSKGLAIQQLNPDDFTKTIDGSESIVAQKDKWDSYQGVYVWIPRLYFQATVSGGSHSVTEYPKEYDPTSYNGRSDSGYLQNAASRMFIVASEEKLPDQTTTFLGSGSDKNKIKPNIPYPNVTSHSSEVSSNEGGKNGYSTINPGFVDNDKTEYRGIWVPCYYANKDGKSWPDSAATLSSASEVNDLMDVYKGSKVRLFGGTIWETLNMILTYLAKSFDISGTYGLGFKSADRSNDAPDSQTCTPSKSGFTFSDSGWNKIFHSYVLGSNAYFVIDPYLKVTKPYTASADNNTKDYSIFESTNYNTNKLILPAIESSSYLRIPDNYALIWSYGSLRETGENDRTEITGYFSRPAMSDDNSFGDNWDRSHGRYNATVNRIPSMSATDRPRTHSPNGYDFETTKESLGYMYSHQSIRGLLDYAYSSTDDLVYYDFALRRAPHQYNSLGLSEFLSIYAPLKTNMDTYMSKNLVAYATMVFPPDSNYVPLIKEE